ncbi:glycosyltransferase involved in cell wall biosynthesis [Salinibacter ruber]|uniref:Glycosyltransferase involved in cell wall biosynthesis n=1 Tax=Salinibacter ruber TaxID=146919 RepID=A0A9X2Q386_9BACT|nr:glycosyltransferase family 2 protein [Salinibacter ruber]MCS3678758.1 glycosyltransferase involved in cell wall biosynthesis [Salinibacter ruber]MCS3682323.1 glycosyltransferase involved in cell wall biosynthesis [Salinibacter ruber]
MNLNSITPLVLTYNEEANLDRTLDRLTWAERVVVVDSYSNDATVDIATSHANVDLVQREFDNFASQCNYGLRQIETEWVLSLDADYVCSEDLVDEVRALPKNPSVNGFSAEFVYCVFGDPLRGSLYPPRTVLYRRAKADYQQDGHGHRVRIDGPVEVLDSPIYHDDRKSLPRWLDNQREYARLEAEKLQEEEDLSLQDRLRTTNVLGPLVVPLYCLLWKGLILDGWSGWYYTLQRTYAELLLALTRLDVYLRGSVGIEFDGNTE